MICVHAWLTLKQRSRTLSCAHPSNYSKPQMSFRKSRMLQAFPLTCHSPYETKINKNCILISRNLLPLIPGRPSEYYEALVYLWWVYNSDSYPSLFHPAQYGLRGFRVIFSQIAEFNEWDLIRAACGLHPAHLASLISQHTLPSWNPLRIIAPSVTFNLSDPCSSAGYKPVFIWFKFLLSKPRPASVKKLGGVRVTSFFRPKWWGWKPVFSLFFICRTSPRRANL